MRVPLAELSDFTADFIVRLPKAAGPRAHIVGLKGELGAGKTTFVQFLARHLGIAESVRSPTFVIAQPYAMSFGPFKRLVHVDAYRVTPADDSFGWDSFANNSENLILVEWPEHLGKKFPSDAPVLVFSVTGPEERDITLHAEEN